MRTGHYFLGGPSPCKLDLNSEFIISNPRCGHRGCGKLREIFHEPCPEPKNMPAGCKIYLIFEGTTQAVWEVSLCWHNTRTLHLGLLGGEPSWPAPPPPPPAAPGWGWLMYISMYLYSYAHIWMLAKNWNCYNWIFYLHAAAGCGVWSVIRNSASVSLSLNPFKGLSRSCWEPQERSSHIKSSSARPFLIFPRECWLISHQFVNAINVALHVEWDHFQDLRHTNCLVWSLLQSSLLCLNQLNCSTEEVGPEQSAGLHTLLPTNDMSMNGADIGRWKERKPCDC